MHNSPTPIVMVEGIETPAKLRLRIENIPQAEKLRQLLWVKASDLAQSLRPFPVRGRQVTIPDFFGDFRFAHGQQTAQKKLWLSANEFCVFGDNDPSEPRAELYFPEECASLLHLIVKGTSISERL